MRFLKDAQDALFGSQGNQLLLAENETSVLEPTTEEEIRREDEGRQDVESFMGFLATHRLDDMARKTGILVTGLSRAGKSSLILVQRGSTMRLGEDDEFEPHSREGDPLVSSSAISKTTHIRQFKDNKNKEVYFDTAGFDENRSSAYKQWARLSLETGISLVEELKGVIVVINGRTTLDNCANADTLRKLAMTLKGFAGQRQAKKDFYNSMIFVVATHSPRKERAYVLKRVKGLLKDHYQAYSDTLTRLQRNYPKNGRMTRIRLKRVGALNYLRKIQVLLEGIDEDNMHKEEEADKDVELRQTLEATIEFLEAMQEHPEKIIISYPNGWSACKKQRESIELALRGNPRLTKSTLRQILLSNCSRNFKAYTTLGSVAEVLSVKLVDYNAALRKLLTFLSQKREILRRIDSDPSAAQRGFIATYRREVFAHKDEIENARRLRNTLQESERLVPIPEATQYVNVYFDDANTWNKFLRFLGFGKLVHYVRYSGWCQDIDVSGDSVESFVLARRTEKETKVKLVSKRNTDLVATVSFMEKLNRLDSTNSQISQLEKDIEKRTLEVHSLESKINTLQALTRDLKKHLIDIEVLGNARGHLDNAKCAANALREKIETTIRLGTEDDDMLDVTYADVIKGFSRLYSALKGADAFPKVFFRDNPTVKSQLDRLMKLHSEMEGLHKEADATAAFEDLQMPRILHRAEIPEEVYTATTASSASVFTTENARKLVATASQVHDFINVALGALVVLLINQYEANMSLLLVFSIGGWMAYKHLTGKLDAVLGEVRTEVFRCSVQVQSLVEEASCAIERTSLSARGDMNTAAEQLTQLISRLEEIADTETLKTLLRDVVWQCIPGPRQLLGLG